MKDEARAFKNCNKDHGAWQKLNNHLIIKVFNNKNALYTLWIYTQNLIEYISYAFQIRKAMGIRSFTAFMNSLRF